MMLRIFFKSQYEEKKFGNLSRLLNDSLADECDIIHNGRNKIWSVNLCDTQLVVKKFGNEIIKRIIYSIKPTKAKKSMLNAIKLIERGVSTPYPIAFAERRNKLKILKESWYITEYETSDSLGSTSSIYGSKAIDAFAEFVANLHDMGIVHNDLNNTNVRVTISSNGRFHFSLIDLNRMRIYPEGHIIPQSIWMKDVCRFCSIDNGFYRFSSEYLRHRGFPPQLLDDMIKTKKSHDRKNIFLKKLKSLIKK